MNKSYFGLYVPESVLMEQGGDDAKPKGIRANPVPEEVFNAKFESYLDKGFTYDEAMNKTLAWEDLFRVTHCNKAPEKPSKAVSDDAVECIEEDVKTPEIVDSVDVMGFLESMKEEIKDISENFVSMISAIHVIEGKIAEMQHYVDNEAEGVTFRRGCNEFINSVSVDAMVTLMTRFNSKTEVQNFG